MMQIYYNAKNFTCNSFTYGISEWSLVTAKIWPWHRGIVTIIQWNCYRCHGTNSPLYLAFLNGIVKLLLCSNHMVEIVMQKIPPWQDMLWTPLHLASWNGHCEILSAFYYILG